MPSNDIICTLLSIFYFEGFLSNQNNSIHICSQTSFNNVLIFNKNEPWKSLDNTCDTIFLSSAKVRKRKYPEGFCSVPKLSSCYFSCSFPIIGHIRVKVSVKKSSCYLVFPAWEVPWTLWYKIPVTQWRSLGSGSSSGPRSS